MFKAFNSIKEILLVFYQVLFVEAKERYEITEVYLENIEKMHKNQVECDKTVMNYQN
ncbi:hypothetical protein [uncultured Treponema sp.]|uniref:hypothetical protein n=1 Tax=uncultured Treponema sp. TaxID=162155 RepID=UPI0025FDD7F1|nr:hypothetical protein [uncultured Treponema sp.]